MTRRPPSHRGRSWQHRRVREESHKKEEARTGESTGRPFGNSISEIPKMSHRICNMPKPAGVVTNHVQVAAATGGGRFSPPSYSVALAALMALSGNELPHGTRSMQSKWICLMYRPYAMSHCGSEAIVDGMTDRSTRKPSRGRPRFLCLVRK